MKRRYPQLSEYDTVRAHRGIAPKFPTLFADRTRTCPGDLWIWYPCFSSYFPVFDTLNAIRAFNTRRVAKMIPFFTRFYLRGWYIYKRLSNNNEIIKNQSSKFNADDVQGLQAPMRHAPPPPRVRYEPNVNINLSLPLQAFCVPFPLFHVSGMEILCLGILYGNKTVFPSAAYDMGMVLRALKRRKVFTHQGRIQDFHVGGGGAQKVMYQHAHYERGTELTFGRGPGLA